MLAKNDTDNGFTCENCGSVVPPAGHTARNHCPACLCSVHVDGSVPGDRSCPCAGVMPAIEAYQKHGDWYVRHRCRKCGFERAAKVLPDDDQDRLLEVMRAQR